MKGFSSLAALLLAHNALANPVAAAVNDAAEIIPTAYVTLKVPIEGDGSQKLSLRLDLQQSGNACGRALLNVNGAPLSQNATGQGQGALTLLDGVIISTSWSFDCYNDQQFMQMVIHSINGRNVEDDVSFRVAFQQTAPIRIKNIQGANQIKLIHQLISHEEHSGGGEEERKVNRETDVHQSTSPFDKDIDAKISALEDLRHQAHNLKNLIREKEDEIMNKLSEVDYDRLHVDSPVFLKTCTDLDCIFRVLAYKMSHSDTSACRDAKHWRDTLSCVSEKEDDRLDHKMLEELIVEDDIKHKYDAYEEDWDEIAALDDDDEWTEEDEEYWAWARLTMMVDIVKAALAFTCIYLCIEQYQRHRANSRTGQILLQHSDEERRKLSFNDYFHGLFRNEDDELFNEKTGMLPRWEKAQPNQAATVAAELNSFRDAASVVSDMIDAADAPRRTGESTDREEDEDKEEHVPPFL